MVQTCCAVNCGNSTVKEEGISLHKFPLNDPELLAKWVQAVKRDEWKPTKHSKLCSAHFEKDDFYPNQSKKQLRDGVVPSIFAHCPKIRENLEVSSTVKDTDLIVYILPIVISPTPSMSS